MRVVTTLMLIALCVVVLGLGLGVATLRLYRAPWDSGLDDAISGRRESAPPPDQPTPRAVFDEQVHHFGEMDIDGKGEHDFVVRNVGQAPLRLRAGGGSCRCAVGRIEHEEVPPGGSSRVTVEWTPDNKVGAYEHTVRIETNDPTQPVVTLKIAGRVAFTVRVEPHHLLLSRVDAGEPTSAEVFVWCHEEEPLEILGYELAQPETEEFFEVGWEPVEPPPAAALTKPVGPDPMDREIMGSWEIGAAEEDARVPVARSGFRVEIAIKPGLPRGPFRQTIRLRTNLGAVPLVEIPVEGMVVGQVGVAGQGWNDDRGILDLGVVSADRALSRRLLLVARGEDHEQVRFRIARVQPEVLKADLREEERTTLANGRVTQTPLVVQIPENSPSANHLGSELGRLGLIEIETTHSKVPVLRIYVRFAVEGAGGRPR